MRRIVALGLAFALGGVTAVLLMGHSAASTSQPLFPRAVYPPATTFLHVGYLVGCASRAGVQMPGPGAKAEAFAVLSRFNNVSPLTDFQLSDQSMWPHIPDAWANQNKERTPLQPRNVVGFGVGNSSSHRAAGISHSCGAEIFRRSVWFAICGRRCGPALTSYYYLIKRRGTWLVWFDTLN